MEFTKPQKIFIVDDDEMLSEALKDFLTRKNPHQVHCYKTGEECLRNLSENPNIIILDYNLNSVEKDAANGMEILQVIKKTMPFVHVIMLSSQERYGVALQTIQKGAEQYVVKDESAFEKIEAMVKEFAS